MKREARLRSQNGTAAFGTPDRMPVAPWSLLVAGERGTYVEGAPMILRIQVDARRVPRNAENGFGVPGGRSDGAKPDRAKPVKTWPFQQTLGSQSQQARPFSHSWRGRGQASRATRPRLPLQAQVGAKVRGGDLSGPRRAIAGDTMATQQVFRGWSGGLYFSHLIGTGTRFPVPRF